MFQEYVIFVSDVVIKDYDMHPAVAPIPVDEVAKANTFHLFAAKSTGGVRNDDGTQRAAIDAIVAVDPLGAARSKVQVTVG